MKSLALLPLIPLLASCGLNIYFGSQARSAYAAKLEAEQQLHRAKAALHESEESRKRYMVAYRDLAEGGHNNPKIHGLMAWNEQLGQINAQLRETYHRRMAEVQSSEAAAQRKLQDLEDKIEFARRLNGGLNIETK